MIIYTDGVTDYVIPDLDDYIKATVTFYTPGQKKRICDKALVLTNIPCVVTITDGMSWDYTYKYTHEETGKFALLLGKVQKHLPSPLYKVCIIKSYECSSMHEPYHYVYTTHLNTTDKILTYKATIAPGEAIFA